MCLTSNELKFNETVDNKISFAVSSLTAEFNSFKTEFLKIATETCSVNPTSTPSMKIAEPAKYSDILKNKTTPAIVIKPKNTEQGTSQTKADVLQNVNPVHKNIQISKIKEIKNGGLLIGCKTKEENAKFKRIVEETLTDAYEVKELHGVNPRIRIVGITEKFSEDEITNYIIKMNSDLINPDCNLIKLFPTKKNVNVYQAVLQVDKISYEKVMKAGNLLIGYDNCRVYDAVDIFRCFNCNEFHHSSKLCKNKVSCPRCGESHSVKECKAKALKCINCVSLNNAKNLSISISHAAWDVNNCTAYIQARDRLRSDLIGVK